MLSPGTTSLVSDVRAVDGVMFLNLADGRGWIANDHPFGITNVPQGFSHESSLLTAIWLVQIENARNAHQNCRIVQGQKTTLGYSLCESIGNINNTSSGNVPHWNGSSHCVPPSNSQRGSVSNHVLDCKLVVSLNRTSFFVWLIDARDDYATFNEGCNHLTSELDVTASV